MKCSTSENLAKLLDTHMYDEFKECFFKEVICHYGVNGRIDKKSTTPLMWLINEDKIPQDLKLELIRILLDMGADPILANKDPFNSYEACLYTGQDYVLSAILEGLSDNGLNQFREISSRHLAISAGHCKIVNILLQFDADRFGRSCLMLASLYKQTDIVKLLLNAKENLTLVDLNDKTVINHALDTIAGGG